jgi:hypothetical protein
MVRDGSKSALIRESLFSGDFCARTEVTMNRVMEEVRDALINISN